MVDNRGVFVERGAHVGAAYADDNVGVEEMDNKLFEMLEGKQLNYTAPFLWLHNEDDKYILDEIERRYESGIRSLCLESRTHEEFPLNVNTAIFNLPFYY